MDKSVFVSFSSEKERLFFFLKKKEAKKTFVSAARLVLYPLIYVKVACGLVLVEKAYAEILLQEAKMVDTAIAVPPDAAFAAMQRNFACWSRAMTQVAHGFMTAEIAQMDLLRTLCADDWSLTQPNANAQDFAAKWLDNSQSKFRTALYGYRQINDDLAKNLFEAAKSAMEGFSPLEDKQSEVSPLPAPARRTAKAG
jgi:hypothetical protein